MDENITLDGKPVTIEQLNEAKENKSVRIVEDKDHPGQYHTLKHLQEG